MGLLAYIELILKFFRKKDNIKKKIGGNEQGDVN